MKPSSQLVTGSPSRIVGTILAILFFLFCLAFVKTNPDSWNDIARIATIESLAERGSWAIDESAWVDHTADKVFLDGKFYSDKMPVLSFIGAGVYAILRAAFGASLAPNCHACAYAPLTLIMVALPAALTLWLFFDFAARMNAPLWAATVGTIALGAGTMMLPYALVFNHHVPAACALFASFYRLSLRAVFAKPRTPSPSELGIASSHPSTSLRTLLAMTDERVWLFAAGFLAALAIAFDISAGILAASVAGIAIVRWRREFVWFALGATVPMIATALLDYQIAQTIIPPYMITNGYNYPGSEFPATFAGNGTPDDYAAYAFRMFLGGKGLFAFNPLLLFAFAGAAVTTINAKHRLRVEAFFIVVGFVALCIYLATNTGNYGGTAYGERWFIPAIPLLFSFIFFAPPLSATTGKSFAWGLFVPVLALSVFSSLQGAQAPWREALPPLQMTRDVNHFPFFGFKWNGRLP